MLKDGSDFARQNKTYLELRALEWKRREWIGVSELLPPFLPMAELRAQKADFCLQLYFQQLHLTTGIQNSEII